MLGYRMRFHLQEIIDGEKQRPLSKIFRLFARRLAFQIQRSLDQYVLRSRGNPRKYIRRRLLETEHLETGRPSKWRVETGYYAMNTWWLDQGRQSIT